ncbi:hypothetical protein HMPREF9078_02386, partial [Capnocytophaga sp. oral taxon 380 str. F0488]
LLTAFFHQKPFLLSSELLRFLPNLLNTPQHIAFSSQTLPKFKTLPKLIISIIGIISIYPIF